MDEENMVSGVQKPDGPRWKKRKFPVKEKGKHFGFRYLWGGGSGQGTSEINTINLGEVPFRRAEEEAQVARFIMEWAPRAGVPRSATRGNVPASEALRDTWGWQKRAGCAGSKSRSNGSS